MKKIIAVAALVCGLSAILSAQTAVIREISGKVEIKAAGKDWAPAAAGQPVDNATVISTGLKSTALIAIGNSVLTVRPLTRLTLEELQETRAAGQAGNERVALSLQTGRVRADVAPPAGGKTSFTVRSPSATASVRGTTFEFDGTRLAVSEGRVRLAGGDGMAVFVNAGHQVVADTATGRTPTAVETVREELRPTVPAGVPAASTSEPVGTPSNAAGRTGSVTIGVEWW